jgi:hypothetical protein
MTNEDKIGWWSWGIIYDVKHECVLITLRDLVNGEREWTCRAIDDPLDPVKCEWQGYWLHKDVFVIAVGGFAETIEHLQETTQLQLPGGVLAFYDKLKAEAATSH